MSRSTKSLDDLVNAVRSAPVDEQEVSNAGARVWSVLKRVEDGVDPSVSLSRRLESCIDYQSLITPYLAGELSHARTLLLEDHTRGCVPCRRALRTAKTGGGAVRARVPASPTGISSAWKRAAAVLVVATGAWAWSSGVFEAPAEHLVEVRSFEGVLLAGMGAEQRPLAPGDWLDEGEVIRTGQGASALLGLADGSLIELRERSTMSVGERRSRTTIDVAQGDVIVAAADQRGGELRVSTDDCLVTVHGTIFSVSHGVKGSRVAVIEGEVQVEQGRRRDVLLPGDQFVSNLRVGALPLADVVSWSQNSEHYLELLQELNALREDLREVPLASELRYSTQRLDLLPADSVMIASLPNPGPGLGEIRRIFDERLESSPILQEWWQGVVGEASIDSEGAEVLAQLRNLAEELGDEIVLGVAGVESPMIVAIADLRNPSSFDSVLAGYLEKIEEGLGGDGRNTEVQIVVDPRNESSDVEGLLFWMHDGAVVVGNSMAGLQAVAERDGRRSRLQEQLARSFSEGIELAAGIDLSRLLPQVMAESSAAGSAGREDRDEVAFLEWSGLNDAEFLIAEGRTVDGMSQTSVILSFAEERTGVASWIDVPGPMGALDYVSADAHAVSAVLMRDPVDLYDELWSLLEGLDPEARVSIEEAEAHLGLDLRADLVMPMGGEAAMALDGPLLPTPAWTFVVEVYDPIRLQQSIELLVETSRRLAEDEGVGSGEDADRPVLTLEAASTAGVWELGSSGKSRLAYTFDGAYLVAAPNAALLQRALRVRSGGHSILDSQRLRDLMPADRFLNFSALAFQDLGSAVAPLATRIAELGSDLPAEQVAMIENLSAGALAASLYAIYGEDDAVRFTATSEGGLLGAAFGRLLDLGQLASAGGMLSMAGVDTGP